MSTTVGKFLSHSVVFIKKKNPLRLHQWCFPGKFMNFSEAATGGASWKKILLKFFQYSQENIKNTPTPVFSSEYCQIFKNTYLEEHLLTTASNFLKQLQNSGELLSSVLTLLLKLHECRFENLFISCSLYENNKLKISH